MRRLHAAHRRTAIEAQEESEAAAGGGAVHFPLSSTHRHNCLGEVTLVSADRQSMSRAHDQRAIPVMMCAKFDTRTSATNAPSMNTSMKFQGRTRVSTRSTAF